MAKEEKKARKRRKKEKKEKRARTFTQLSAELKRSADSIEKMVERFIKGRSAMDTLRSDALRGVAEAVSNLRKAAQDALDDHFARNIADEAEDEDGDEDFNVTLE